MAFIDPDKIYPNFKKTFGTLLFNRVKYYEYEQDAEGNNIEDKIIASHIDIDSSVQRGEIAAVIKGAVDENIKFGDEVTLINPHIVAYAIPQDTLGREISKGFSLKVDEMHKVSATPNKPTVSANNKKN